MMKNIIAFGSCLSRYTAREYIKGHGGVLLSSVYHNRSDAFVKRFLSEEWNAVDVEKMMHDFSISAASLEDEGTDSVPYQILKNQTYDAIGLHRLKNGTPFFDAIESKKVDLILVDNYMDLSAKFLIFEGCLEKNIFLAIENKSVSGLTVPEGWTLGGILPVEEAVACMGRILDYLRERQPLAKIVFMNFPHNTYAQNPDRVARTKLYESSLKKEGVYFIPCLDIPEDRQTEKRSHFTASQYRIYADLAHGFR